MLQSKKSSISIANNGSNANNSKKIVNKMISSDSSEFDNSHLMDDEDDEGEDDTEGYIQSPSASTRSNEFGYTEEKMEKSRERNREHAKRTRLRKKAVIEGMKERLLALQTEASKLQEMLEENNTANILLCLSTNISNASSNANSTNSSNTTSCSNSNSVSSVNSDNGSDNNSNSSSVNSNNSNSHNNNSSESNSNNDTNSNNNVSNDESYLSTLASTESNDSTLASVVFNSDKNIIDELRNRVRVEAALQQIALQRKQQSHLTVQDVNNSNANNLRNNSITTSTTSSSSSGSGGTSPPSSSASSENGTQRKQNDNMEMMSSDDENDPSERKWDQMDGLVKDNTGLIVGGSETYRKERNRLHAKLTRDRKKLFTSRMQQLINSLERQNAALKSRLSIIKSNGGSNDVDNDGDSSNCSSENTQ